VTFYKSLNDRKMTISYGQFDWGGTCLKT